MKNNSVARSDTSTGASLTADGVGKGFESGGAWMQAIGGVSFELKPGEFVSIVGPSGCGKTTLLRCLAGLSQPDSGLVTFDGSLVDGVPASMSIVFQEYGRSLFPWLTVLKNVTFGLHDLPRSEAKTRALECLDMVGIAEFADRHPWQLSGGMQQRVAIARAIATHPRCLLLDEPFASVDALTRESLEELTLTISSELGLSTLLVTHDIDEAIFMSDRVLVLSPRPSKIVADVRIELPKPRDEVETRALSEFADHRREIHHLVRHRTQTTAFKQN